MMAPYLALQIMKGNLDYISVIKKFGKYKEDIDQILVAEGKQDMIKEVN